MSKRWLISDTHFGHDKVYTTFTDRYTGQNLRPWAANADEGDEYIRDMWNDMIGPDDKVYHLGDVAIPRRGLKCLKSLPGRKILLHGNHDIFKLKDYAEYFENMIGTSKLADVIISHYPIHEESIPQWAKGNIHGHTHSDHVWNVAGEIKNPRYLNVCVEQTNGKPIELDHAIAMLNGEM